MTSSIKSMLIENYYELKFCSTCTCNLGVFFIWFLYHGKERRREFPRQSIAEVGNLYGISSPNMEKLQSIRQAAVIQFKDHKYYYCMTGEPPIEIGMLREK